MENEGVSTNAVAAGYRYYISAPLIEDGVARGAQGWRIPAETVERAVAHAIAAKLRQPQFQAQMLGDGPDAGAVIGLLGELADLLEAPSSPAGRDVLDRMILRVALGETDLRAEASFRRLGEAADDRFAALSRVGPASVSVAAPLRVQRRGPELRLVLGGPAGPAPTPDPMLVGTLLAGRCRAADYLGPGADLTVSDIARREGTDTGDVSRSLQLAFLAPDIVERILDGTQPAALTAERLKRIDVPLLWNDQRALIG